MYRCSCFNGKAIKINYSHFRQMNLTQKGTVEYHTHTHTHTSCVCVCNLLTGYKNGYEPYLRAPHHHYHHRSTVARYDAFFACIVVLAPIQMIKFLSIVIVVCAMTIPNHFHIRIRMELLAVFALPPFRRTHARH